MISFRKMSFKRIDCDFFFCRAIDLFLLSVCGKISVKATWQWNCESIFILGNCAIFLSLSLFDGVMDFRSLANSIYLSKLKSLGFPNWMLCQFHHFYVNSTHNTKYTLTQFSVCDASHRNFNWFVPIGHSVILFD